jgi:hypothetical protein
MSYSALTRTARPVGLMTIIVLGASLAGAGVAIDRVAEAGLKRLLLTSKYRYMRVYAAEPPARTLILGNSRGAVHFPHSTGKQLEYFNLANGGMGVAYSAALALDYIDHHGAPEMTVIEMSFITDPKTGEAAAGLTRVFSERARGIRNDATPFRRSAEQAFHLLHFNHPTLLNALAGLAWDRKERAVNTRVSAAALKHIEESPPYEWMPAAENVANLAGLLANLRQRNVAVVCVLTPLLKEVRDKVRDFGGFVAAVRSIAESNGAVFLDYSGAIAEPDLFADAAHLNVEGVKRFQELALPQLASLKKRASRGER